MSLSQSAIAELPGPEWLRQRRSDAFERLEQIPVPSPAEEIWRYSRIDELDLGAFAPATSDAPTVSEAARAALVAVPDAAATVVLVDGRLASLTVSDAAAKAGLAVRVGDDPDALGSVMAEPADHFAALNDAVCGAPVVVRVPRGRTIDGPVVVVNVVDGDGVLVAPRLVVVAGDDSEVTVVERFVGTGCALVVPVTEVVAATAARVSYLTINELGPKAWQVGSLVSSGERDSTTRLAAVALGGDYARLRIDARLVGQGASGEQVAVYYGEGSQMHDFRTLQDHAAPKTSSSLLFKGAVQDQSRSVYTGLIKVRPEARGTTAFQTNRNIKLSEGAWAESVPNLEIETNDVKCSHASAVGPIDEDQRFYLESRGVPSAVAERLIVVGFFDEVLAQLPVPTIVDALRAVVAAKLERRV